MRAGKQQKADLHTFGDTAPDCGLASSCLPPFSTHKPKLQIFDHIVEVRCAWGGGGLG